MSSSTAAPTTKSNGGCSIAPYSPARVALYLVGSASYVAAKTCASPALYLARRAGWKAEWPRRLDATLNRTLMPQTERPDGKTRRDVEPALAPGDPMPDVTVLRPDGTPCSIRSFFDRPVLLVAVRGSWCPYSRLHLADLDSMLERFESANVRVIAVSHQADPDLWTSWGVRIPVLGDPEGALFRALGVLVEHWKERAWGRVVPYESAFLFDGEGRLVAADVRRVSSYRTRQTFLSGKEWLRLVETRAYQQTQERGASI